MLYLPLEMLEPGMTLARDIPNAHSRIPLVRAGQVLTLELIRSLLERGIPGLYVENQYTDGIEVEDVISQELRSSLVCDIKHEFQLLTTKNTVPDAKVIGKMGESIVTSVLKHRDLSLNMVDIRDYDNYTYYHSINVGVLAVMMGVRLRFPLARLQQLSAAGLLHDVGKVDLPLSIINKPGALTKEEFALIQEHPTLAVDRLSRAHAYTPETLTGVASHHEKFSGTGYPRKLSGTDIPLFGRILAISDVYDALSSKRSYRAAWEPYKIIDYMLSLSDTHFDPELLPAFLRCVVAYPAGTLVKLSDGSIGVVVRNTSNHPLRPVIRRIYPSSLDRNAIDLSEGHFNITIVGVPDRLPPDLQL